MNAGEFPKDAIDFDNCFATEQACQEYLLAVRWPQGFVCPACGHCGAWLNNRRLLVCRTCGRQVSLTAGTVMQGSRKPLRMWFKAMWWVCTQKTGGSAKGLQRLLNLGSYQTAWAWLHKLRRAMIRAGREPLEGPVEVDDAFIGGAERHVMGRESLKKAKIVAAVEVPGGARTQPGRIRLARVPDFSRRSLTGFVRANVRPGSEVITDGWQGYNPLGSHGYVHHRRAGESELLGHVHRVVSLLKRWLLGTHHGAVRPGQLQHYLDEFTFRYNRRKSRHVGKLFHRMLQGACAAPPATYLQLRAGNQPPPPSTTYGVQKAVT